MYFADTLKKEEHPMELTVSVTEVEELIKDDSGEAGTGL
jgi:hypothetical protein